MRIETRHLTTTAAVTLAVALLAGCTGNDGGAASSTSSSSAPTTSAPAPSTSSSAPAPSTSSSPAPVPAKVTATDKAFTVTLPATWREDTTAVGGEATLAAKRREAVAGFEPLLIVTPGTGPGDDLATVIVNTGKKKAEQLGGTYAALPPRTIGGVKAPGYSVTVTKNGTPQVYREYFVAKGGKLYLVTLAAAAAQASVPAQETDKILASWTWR